MSLLELGKREVFQLPVTNIMVIISDLLILPCVIITDVQWAGIFSTHNLQWLELFSSDNYIGLDFFIFCKQITGAI